MKKVILVVILVGLTGCVRHYFQPPPPEYKMWIKPGATELMIKKALMECGAPNPRPSANSFTNAYRVEGDSLLNAIIEVDMCMEDWGFVSKWGSVKKVCKLPHNKHLPACRPGAVAPKSSIERRLNSMHCKKKSDYDYCVKHASNPSGCKHNDYSRLPPECLR